MNDRHIHIPTLIWVANRIKEERSRYCKAEMRTEAFLVGLDEIEITIRAIASRLSRGEGINPTTLVEDRCPHAMFYSGAGACPQCGQ